MYHIYYILATLYFYFVLTIFAVPAPIYAQSNCDGYGRLWVEWCIYTYTDAAPDAIFPGFDNVYHPSVWERDGKWNIVIGGWKDAALQGQQDQIFRAITDDPYGITGWQLVENNSTTQAYIDNSYETSVSTDIPDDVNVRGQGTDVSPYLSQHTVQPHVVSVKELPLKSDGTRFDCCDTIYYSYDYNYGTAKPFPPEYKVGMHYSFIDNNNVLRKAGEYGAKNPLIDWNTYSFEPNSKVTAVSDARVTYDPVTKKFYMVYAEWLDNPATAVTSIAVASWTNTKFTVVARDICDGVFCGNPHIVVGPDNKYYLFYTRFWGGGAADIRVKTSSSVTGPYINDRLVLKDPDQTMRTLGTPFVFCNTKLNQWQMFFSGSPNGGLDNNIYTAFLKKQCDQPPVWSNPTSIPGDINGDGIIDPKEWNSLFLRFYTDTIQYDFDDNRYVNTLDFRYMYQEVSR